MLSAAQSPQPRGRIWPCGLSLTIAAVLSFGRVWAVGAELATAHRAFNSGQYDQSIAMAREVLKSGQDKEDAATLLSDALIIKGRYAEAFASATNALAGEPRSIRLRWRVREALRLAGHSAAAERITVEIQQLFAERYWSYRNAADLAIFGRVALAGGMEPKLVLDRIYDAAKRTDPRAVDPYLASGFLALEKHDFALAARYFHEGLKQIPDNPELQFGLAQAYAPSDPRSMLRYVTAVLEQNSNHVGSLLLLAEHSIDSEDYSEAEKLLSRVDAVNPAHPECWAYRAVIAHLKNRPEDERNARDRALKSWARNPRVDHLIGLKLSQKYRFAEGAACQRRALAFDPNFLQAKGQLAQDLLRLGEEAEGWHLADEVQRADGYDVAANNLVTLRDVIGKFTTVTNEHFVLRMHSKEAALYGRRALELLERARARLCSAYQVEFSRPVLVELFHEEKDFAVRTFGMPENNPFLGVCFGMVITANSPGARPGSEFNWESMLWHEFCHAVTLHITRNKMPRWLSEGISVYEERQANPAWGERMDPRYREMILGEDLTPVSRLSGAFLAPKSPLHMQFAYYESSLVVEFLSERFGRDKLLNILRELSEGIEINEALAKHTLPLAQLERDFEAFARKLASDLAPGVDWERPGSETISERGNSRRGGANPGGDTLARLPDSVWESWAQARPTNYWVMLRQANRLSDEKKWAEAKPVLEQLVKLYPGASGESSPYRNLATACRELGDTRGERHFLALLAEQDDAAPDVYLRLMELASETDDWQEVLTNTGRFLAVNPLVPAPYRFLAEASEAVGDVPAAIQAYRALLQLDPPNPADIHFHLAALLHRQRDPQARMQVLRALEEAPRFREALLLFRQIRHESPSTGEPSQ